MQKASVKYLNKKKESYSKAEVEKMLDPWILDPRKNFYLADSFGTFLRVTNILLHTYDTGYKYTFI